MQEAYTVKQVADILGYSTNSIYSFLKEGRLKGIRVGRGRFRISEEELARVLHLKKGLAFEGEAEIERAPVREPVLARSAAVPSVVAFVIGKRWVAPTIFDWMVGLSAIVSGTALFLFNRTYQPVEAARLALIIPYTRWMLISCGAGLLVSRLAGGRRWYGFFAVVLSLTGLFHAWMLWQAADADGAVVYGLLAIVVGVSAWVQLPDALGVSAYVTLLALAAPLLVYFAPNDFHIASVLSHVELSPFFGALAVGVSAALFLFGYWGGRKKRGIGFWISCWAAGFALIGASVYNAQLVYWSRSFFFLTIAFSLLYLPVYLAIEHEGTRRMRWLTQGLFGMVGGLLFAALVVVGLLQSVVWQQNMMEFMNKTTYASTLMTTSMDSVRSTLMTASQNPELIAALVDADGSRLETLSKVIYEGNPMIRRLVFLDAEGNGVALYPHGTFDQKNFAFRDYFTRPKETRQPYVSELFASLADGAGRKVVTVSVPMISDDRAFVGVMAGSVDLMRLGSVIQRVAIGSRKERFVVVDKSGSIVIAPDPTDIGEKLPEGDTLWHGVRGEQGAGLAPMRDGTLGLITYASMPVSGWAVSLRAPASRVYTLNQPALIMVFAVVGVVVLAACAWMFVLHIRVKLPGAPGP